MNYKLTNFHSVLNVEYWKVWIDLSIYCVLNNHIKLKKGDVTYHVLS